MLTRSVLEREENVPFDFLYPLWQRMEWRGQVRRGIFVADMPGVQYALPEAVEQLRATQNLSDETPYVLNATDPANLFGGEASAWKFARVFSTHVVLWRGQPVLIVQENGERISAAENVSDEILREALRAYFERANAPRHATVTEWNEEKILGTRGETLLNALGFFRMPKGMERWRQ